MKIEELKQGQTVWVKGYVDCSVFGGCGGFINFYNKDGNNHCHISRNNVREMKEEDVQIDQPKPVLPKFMADWIEDHKGDYSKWDEEARADFVFRAINDLFRFGEGLSFWDFTIDEKFSEWTTKNAYEFITAILFGYTVEKEKSYQIIDKRLNATFSCLGYDIEGRAWFWGNKKFFLKNKGVRLAHTRQQLIDAGFEEVLENPNYEAEEVKNDL
ncbi:DUF1642 domain-containing protein [Streptococcus uberis]|uniref:DUF1642 domain-containing protein n=1 Tax=Streptococcus uberis TaxID=1349 RepID=UPI00333E1C2A